MMTNAQLEQYDIVMNHFDVMAEELGMQTDWDITDGGCMKAEQMLFLNREYKVVYTCLRPDVTEEELRADMRDGDGNRTTFVTVTATATNGSIKSLWAAAEACIAQSGTHHRIIDNFEEQDDGTLRLLTGS